MIELDRADGRDGRRQPRVARVRATEAVALGPVSKASSCGRASFSKRPQPPRIDPVDLLPVDAGRVVIRRRAKAVALGERAGVEEQAAVAHELDAVERASKARQSL
jgi:hypothetical protein